MKRKTTLETMTPNIFSTIAENDDDFKITPREKFLKKAAKKLNEIERLKEKGKYHSLSLEECEKLLKEDFWQACLYEEPESDKPNIKEERKRKKEEEKMKKKAEERRVYEEQEQKWREEQKRKEEQEKMQREEQKKRENEEARKRKKQEKKARKNAKGLEEEYRDLLLLHHGNNDKTFRLLSLKYHPDKNVGRTIWANEMQQKLGVYREKYSSF